MSKSVATCRGYDALAFLSESKNEREARRAAVLVEDCPCGNLGGADFADLGGLASRDRSA